MAQETTRGTRADYRRFERIDTRWMDNDTYGHVNNVVYYSWFDTAVNRMLVAEGFLDITGGPLICLVVETGCRYFAPTSFPDTVMVGVRVRHLGTSSVRYEIGLFRNDEDQAVAEGFFVHVQVDRERRRPRPFGDSMREFLSGLRM